MTTTSRYNKGRKFLWIAPLIDPSATMMSNDTRLLPGQLDSVIRYESSWHNIMTDIFEYSIL